MCRASDKCQREKRKTINGDDLLWAMATLGFEDYIDPLKIYLTSPDTERSNFVENLGFLTMKMKLLSLITFLIFSDNEFLLCKF